MKFPQLNDWENTSRALHQASMILAPIQNVLLEPRKNYLNLPMFIEPTGLRSLELPQSGVIHVDYKAGALVYKRKGAEVARIKYTDYTQATLFETLLEILKRDELAAFYADFSGASLTEDLITRLHADETRTAFLKLEDVTYDEPLEYNPQTASDYADVLYGVFTGVARFRGYLTGHMSPIVVWAEHFDLSTLWFHPDNAAMDDGKAHINFGFAPFSDGFEQPYLYVYIYPYPDDFTAPELPAPAVWNREGFRGIVVRYPDLMVQDDAVQFIEALYLQLFDILMPHLSTDV